MMNVAITDHVAFVAFWLGFSRWVTILMQLPLFDNTAVPNIVKVLASFVIAWAFHPLVSPALTAEVRAVGIEHLWALTAVHVGCGLVIGFFVKSFMALFASAGTIITQQIGFASVSYFDPTQAQQTGPFEKLIQWTMVVLILTSGALIPMFKGVTESFYTVNSLNLDKMTQSHAFFGEVFKGIFTAAIMLAAPLLFANILMNLVFGIVARTIPQMNVLMVSFVVNIGVGLLLFIAISQEFFQVSFDIYVERLGQWFQFFAR
ncbi:MAG: flagellar biosynthetic protein FliR [Bacteriovoracaceae bacterium]|nr:flagellar biosynthetic protein FliR [Bacteriovoracaceae bacterium]